MTATDTTLGQAITGDSLTFDISRNIHRLSLFKSIIARRPDFGVFA